MKNSIQIQMEIHNTLFKPGTEKPGELINTGYWAVGRPPMSMDEMLYATNEIKNGVHYLDVAKQITKARSQPQQIAA